MIWPHGDACPCRECIALDNQRRIAQGWADADRRQREERARRMAATAERRVACREALAQLAAAGVTLTPSRRLWGHLSRLTPAAMQWLDDAQPF
jgi:hypothetical protein